MSGPEEEEGESEGSDRSLSVLSGMSKTTCGGEAGGVASKAMGTASVVGHGGGARCATCKEMAKYGTEGSKRVNLYD